MMMMMTMRKRRKELESVYFEDLVLAKMN